MKRRLFSLAELLEGLEEIDVNFKLIGSDQNDCYFFASLRKIESGGFYFYEGDEEFCSPIRNSILLTTKDIVNVGFICIVVDEPQLVFYRLMRHFFASDLEVGVHETAVIDPEAIISPLAYVGPYCVIGKAEIGSGVRLHSHVVVYDEVTVCDDVVIEPHCTLGATGVAWIWDKNRNERVVQPQIGGVWIGEGSFIGSDVTIVRGSVNEITCVGENCSIAHGTKIGHGTVIGENVHFANNVSVAGNVTIGDRSFLGSGCSIRPRISLHPDTVVGAGAVVVKDSQEPNSVLSGVPARKMSSKERYSGVPKPKTTGDS